MLWNYHRIFSPELYQIHNGPDPSSPPLGTRLCGHSLPGANGTLLTSHSVARLHFVSDSSVAHLGFELSWSAADPVCGGELPSSASSGDRTHGTVRSPGYPGQYPHNRDCTWTLRAAPGKRIQFHFATLRIETHRVKLLIICIQVHEMELW